MQELALHLLDVIENSVRAGATRISVTVDQDSHNDVLTLVVEDDGPGFTVPEEKATDPFYTTKAGKRTGLGLSLLKAACEQAGGTLHIARAPLGGARVTATLRLDHVDRMPLGDLSATLSSVLCTNPSLQIACRIRSCKGERVVDSAEVARELADTPPFGLEIARRVSERIRNGLEEIEVSA